MSNGSTKSGQLLGTWLSFFVFTLDEKIKKHKAALTLSICSFQKSIRASKASLSNQLSSCTLLFIHFLSPLIPSGGRRIMYTWEHEYSSWLHPTPRPQINNSLIWRASGLWHIVLESELREIPTELCIHFLFIQTTVKSKSKNLD